VFDLFIFTAQIISSVILLYFGVKIFKVTGGYRTTYGRFTYHMLIIGICFTLLSITGTLKYLRPSSTPLINSIEVIYSLLLCYSFLIAGLELMASNKKAKKTNATIPHTDTFNGHSKGIIPRQVNSLQ
jgi:hypothetical protein